MAMTIEHAKNIMGTVLRSRGARTRIGPLLDERRLKLGFGDAVAAGEVDRTIDALCGYWEQGQLVGAAQIAEAARITRWAASL